MRRRPARHRCLLGLSAASALVLAACSGASTGPSSPPATTVIRMSYPIGLATVGNTVWAVDAQAGTVTPITDPTPKPISVGETPLRDAYDGKLLWVSVFGSGDVVAIDPGTRRIVHRIHVGGQPEGIATATTGVWVVRQQARQVTRIASGRRISVTVGLEPRLAIAYGQAIFVSDYEGGRIYRVAHGRATASPHLCAGAQGLAIAQGALWVTCTAGNEVVTLDPRTLRVLGHVRVDGQPDAIKEFGGGVYVAATAGPTLVQLDPNPAEPVVRSKVSLGDDPPLDDQANVDLAETPGSYWVSSPNGGRLIRVTRSVFPR